MPSVADHSVTVDWAKLLEPHSDGSGAPALIDRAARRLGWSAERREQALARGPCPALAAWPSTMAAGAPLLVPPRYAPAAVDHPNLPAVAALLARWPSADAECGWLLDQIDGFVDTTIPPGQGAFTLGSSSHSFEAGFGRIAVTLDNALGAAQAIVHETAHHRLRALGLTSAGADALIINPRDQCFLSPVAPHRQLTLSALFHEAYSFLWMVELDLRMFALEPDGTLREHILLLLARNLPKAEVLTALVLTHAITDPEGSAMLKAYQAWSARAFEAGRSLLCAHGYGLHVIV